MTGKRSECRCRGHAPDVDETKEHIFAAGRELLLAARGALRFCKEYADATASPATRVQLIKFFGKAISVADELSRGLVSASAVTHKARSVAAPFFEAMGKEMRAEEHEKSAARPAPRSAKARRAARPKAKRR
ncbi:MAG: hypothetical protein WC956_00900 [bacterium]